MSESTDQSAKLLLLKHVHCIGCGYDLFQQPLTGHCPECDTPVQRSRVNLTLDDDVAWQGQIVRGLGWSIVAASAWLACYVLAVTTWFWPPAGVALFFICVATVFTSTHSQRLLWETPPGCEPLLPTRTHRSHLLFETIGYVGLIAVAIAGVAGSVTSGRIGTLAASVGTLFLCVAGFRIISFHRLLRVIAEAIGSSRLQTESTTVFAVRIAIEPALFGFLAASLLMVLTNTYADDPWTVITRLLVIAYGVLQPFVIGSLYNLWLRVREVHQMEEEQAT